MTDLTRPLAAVMAALSLPEERWLPVVGFEDNYLISSMGRVYSIRRGPGTGRILRPSTYVTKRPYLKYGLSKGGVVKTVKAHNLVAEAFIGPRPEGMHVLHGNDDAQDPRLENLRYGTPKENAADCVRNGTHPEARLTHCWRGHELVESNIYHHRGKRYCRACISIRSRMRRRPS